MLCLGLLSKLGSCQPSLPSTSLPRGACPQNGAGLYLAFPNLIHPRLRSLNPGVILCYFSLICSCVCAGLASTVGSGSRGRDGGLVSGAEPPAPRREEMAPPNAVSSKSSFLELAGL